MGFIRIPFAVTVTSVCEGNWSDSATWDLGVPSPSDSVTVNHKIRLDVPVTLNLPASLYISASGDLCGYETLQCEFIADGPLSVGMLIIEGNSINNVFLQSASSIIVNGSWSINGTACAGCSFTCPNITNPCSPPIANFIANNTQICEGNCISFTDLSSNFPSSWQWSFPGGTPSTSTSQNPIVCYSSVGSFDVTLIVTNTGGSDTITMTSVVTVNAKPTTDAGPGGDECGLTHTFSAIPSIGIGTWSQVSGPGVSTFTNVNDSNATVTVTNYGTYVYNWSEVNGICVDSDTVTVNYFQQPIILYLVYSFNVRPCGSLSGYGFERIFCSVSLLGEVFVESR